MPFWKCYYHIIWATKHRQSRIEPVYESVLFGSVKTTSVVLKCNMIAVNCVADHIHVAIQIPPAISVAAWVGRVKGASAHAINQTFELSERFYWQEGYSVHTFGQKALPIVESYIRNQKQHHATDNTNDYLEYLEDC